LSLKQTTKRGLQDSRKLINKFKLLNVDVAEYYEY
jgi:hypothetical protein